MVLWILNRFANLLISINYRIFFANNFFESKQYDASWNIDHLGWIYFVSINPILGNKCITESNEQTVPVPLKPA